METKKKKIVAKVIAKNVLVWICTLCMVLCFIPLRSQAEESDGMDAVAVAEDPSETETTEPTEAGPTPQTETCTVTLTKNGEAWIGAKVVLKVTDGVTEKNEVTLDGSDGTYTGDIEEGITYALWIENEQTPRKTGITTENAAELSPYAYLEITFKDGDDGKNLADVPSQLILSGEDLATPGSNPTKKGFEFKEWVTEKGGETPFVFGKVTEANFSNGDYSVYATWTKKDSDQDDDDEEEETPDDSHNFEWYGEDENGHWQYCTDEDCELYWDGEEPIPDDIRNASFQLHTFVIEEVEAPTCDTPGKGKYVCSVCGYEPEYKDEEPPVSIAPRHTPPSKDEEDAFIIDESTHTYDCEKCDEKGIKEDHVWEIGEDGHICKVCGYKAEHIWDKVEITKAPTLDETGTKCSICTSCGEQKEEKIPKLLRENMGQIQPDVDTNDGLSLEWKMDTYDLVRYLLTDKEKERIAGDKGESVVFFLEASDKSVNPADKVLVNTYLENNPGLSKYHVVTYLDINLYKQIGEDPREAIHEVDGGIVSFSIELPDKLYEKNRSYAIIRVHDGQPEKLEVQEIQGSLFVNADKFSTYAVIYDGDAIDGAGNGNNGNGNNNGNGSNTGNNGNGQNSGNGNNNGNTGNGGNNGASGSTSDTNNGNTGNQGNATTAADSNNNNNNSNTGNASPKTADSSPIVLYMTIAMISAMAYLFLFVTDKDRRMTEQDKDVLIRELTLWARKHGATAKFFMAFAVFCILLYYHTVGKRVKGVVREQA